jgi:hypothetical protein
METKQARFADAHPSRNTPAAPPRSRAIAALKRVLPRVLLAAIAVTLPSAAVAATIKSKVSGAAKLLNPVWNEAKDPNAHRYTFREPSPTVRPDVRNLTAHLPKELCIVALGEKGEPLKVPYRVTLAGGRTTPVTLVVAEGQQIQFENKDPFPHKPFETTGKAGFVPAELGPTKSRAWTPPGPGKYEFRDELAPSLRSWIVVEPKAVAITFPDRKGEFGIELQPGTYKLRGYFLGEPVGKELEVTVTGVDQNLGAPLIVGEAGAAGDKDKDKPEGGGGQ